MALRGYGPRQRLAAGTQGAATLLTGSACRPCHPREQRLSANLAAIAPDLRNTAVGGVSQPGARAVAGDAAARRSELLPRGRPDDRAQRARLVRPRHQPPEPDQGERAPRLARDELARRRHRGRVGRRSGLRRAPAGCCTSRSDRAARRQGTIEITSTISLSTSPDRLRTIASQPPRQHPPPARLLRLGPRASSPPRWRAARGSTPPPTPSLVFETPPDEIWDTAMRSLGINPRDLFTGRGVN